MIDRARNAPEAAAISRLSLYVTLGIFGRVPGGGDTNAQEDEPRSYTNTQVGLNFLIAGYVYSEGRESVQPQAN